MNLKNAPGIVVEAKAKPSKWSIRFCFMYLKVEETEVKVMAAKLVPDATAELRAYQGNNTRVGTMKTPPPISSIAATIPMKTRLPEAGVDPTLPFSLKRDRFNIEKV